MPDIADIVIKGKGAELFRVSQRGWPVAEADRVRVERSEDGGATWKTIPFRLGLASRLRFTIVVPERWPPRSIDSASVLEGVLRLVFRDQWFPWSRQVRADSVEREAEWEATYHLGRQRWTLRRLRVLDYEGPDYPP
jgi:hypothetical protein